MAISETDRLDILLDDEWDIVFDQGDFAFSSGLDGAVQDVLIDLQFIRGEWPLNLRKGIPYFDNDVVTERESLLGQKFEDRKWRNAFREVLGANDLIDEVLELGVDYDSSTRGTTVSFNADTIFGESGTVEVETP